MTTYIPTDDEALEALEQQRQEQAKRAEIAAIRARHMVAHQAKASAEKAVEIDQAVAVDPAHRLAKILAARLGDDLGAFARELHGVNFVRFQAAIMLAQAELEAARRHADVEASARARPSAAEQAERERVSRNLGLI